MVGIDDSSYSKSWEHYPSQTLTHGKTCNNLNLNCGPWTPLGLPFLMPLRMRRYSTRMVDLRVVSDVDMDQDDEIDVENDGEELEMDDADGEGEEEEEEEEEEEDDNDEDEIHTVSNDSYYSL